MQHQTPTPGQIAVTTFQDGTKCASGTSTTSRRPKTRARCAYPPNTKPRNPPPCATPQGIELLFYGDSITQCWRFGHVPLSPAPNSLCHGAPDVFAKHFGSRYNAKVFGVGGDQTAHLMYRLLHGEDPAGLGTRVAVLLIGTNDLGYALDEGAEHMQGIVPSVWQHVEAIVDFLMQRVEHVVLMGTHAPRTIAGNIRQHTCPPQAYCSAATGTPQT